MLERPFLTQLDSRAAIKGSRDPLGVQAIWTRLGRHVVGNLSTVTTSVRDFTVLLAGCYFVEAVADAGATEGDVATFLKWEQLAAYSRAHVDEDYRFRGQERTLARLREGSRRRLSADGGAQILGNQKIYGLWGLYTVPARSSGLLEGDPIRLTPVARRVVEQSLLPTLGRSPKSVTTLVDRFRAKESFIDWKQASDLAVMKAVAELIRVVRPLERATYREHLLYGGPADASPSRGTQGRQRLFADLLAGTLHEADWALTPETLASLAVRAKTSGGEVGQQLAHRLERIRTAELLLAPAVHMFDYVLSCDGQMRSDIAADIDAHWRRVFRETIDVGAIEILEPELRWSSTDTESGGRWVALAHALQAAHYEDAIDLVLAQNAAVMKARSAAAPWAELRGGKLHVRFRDQHAPRLPEAAEIPHTWMHAYFIGSLRSIAAALQESNS